MIPTWISTGRGVFLNDLRRLIKASFMVPAAAQVPLVVAAAPAATVPSVSPPIVLESSQDGPSELFYLTALQDEAVNADVTARMTLTIVDTAWRRALMNQPIPVIHVFGTNLQPAFLNESLFLEEQQTLLFAFNNNSTLGASSLRFQLTGRKFQAAALSRKEVTGEIEEMRQKKLFRSPFWFTSDAPITIPAAGVVDVFFTTAKSNYAVLFKTIASFISTGVAGDLVNGFACEFFDAVTSRPLQNQPIPSSCCSGTAGFPHILATPLMVEPFTQVRVRMTNLITDQPTQVFFTFMGVNFYMNSNPMQAQVGVADTTPLIKGAP